MEKSYHTAIEINAPVDMVWEVLLDTESYPEWNPLVGEVYSDLYEDEEAEVFITPLRQKVKVHVLRRQEYRELRWRGTLGLPQIVAGTHYYILEPIGEGDKTLLKHGEKFSGWLAPLIPQFLLDRMEQAFTQHNLKLKERVEQFYTPNDDDDDDDD